jgi:transcriptional regulator with XRE-family HTH domain
MAKINDKQWFLSSLESKKRSMRKLAEFMILDVSAVSRIFDGKRQLKTEEAAKMAQFLSVSIAEVMERTDLGVRIDGPSSPIPLAAIISKDGNMKAAQEASVLPMDAAERAQAAMRPHRGKITAAQIRARSGPIAFLDDAIVLFGDSQSLTGVAGIMAICQPLSGNEFLARIERARKTGEASVVDVHGKQREVELKSIAPVLAIIP